MADLFFIIDILLARACVVWCLYYTLPADWSLFVISEKGTLIVVWSTTLPVGEIWWVWLANKLCSSATQKKNINLNVDEIHHYILIHKIITIFWHLKSIPLFRDSSRDSSLKSNRCGAIEFATPAFAFCGYWTHLIQCYCRRLIWVCHYFHSLWIQLMPTIHHDNWLHTLRIDFTKWIFIGPII